MKYILAGIIAILLIRCKPGISQEDPARLYAQYEQYKEPTIVDRRFKHTDIVPLIERLGAPFEKQVLGQSVEGRDIYLVKTGNGPINVLLWSQMHGDEPTATMALMDIFNFLSTEAGDFSRLKQRLRDNLSIYFVPMLNPDGAERHERRNALGVDLNRDALRLQTPEGKILKKIRDEIDADWGFNLHDQSRYYSAGIPVNHLASISFLAPAYNYQKEINSSRGNAMKLIVSMNKVLQQFIPKQVAKYSDAFEPRAFGDNIQKWGTNTILIESGGLQDDPEKQELRKLHFVILLHALESIAIGAYQEESVNAYKSIPFNQSNGFKDLLITGVEIEKEGETFIMDIGFKRSEIPINKNRHFYYKGYIDDIGDLSVYRAYDEVAADGFKLVPGKIYPTEFSSAEELSKLNVLKLIQDGYTDFYVKYLTKSQAISEWPIRLHLSGQKVNNEVTYGGNPSFFLTKDGEKRFLVVNGFVWDLIQDESSIKTGLSR